MQHQEAPAPPSRTADRLLPVLVVFALSGIAIGFWILNGPRVFADLAMAAFAYCF